MAVKDVHTDTELHSETLEELSLTKQPFLEQEDRSPLADSETQRTRAALEQNVRFGDSLHLLIGEDGAGKTVLLKQLLKHCKISIKPFVAKGSSDFRAEAFLYAVLNATTKEEKAEGISEYIDKLSPMFEQIFEDQRCALMIVDDAHLAPIEEIAELVDTLQHFENDDGRTARLLLTGTPALKQSIARFEAQFEDLDLRYSTVMVTPMDDERTSEYLTARLHQVGFADAFPFTDKAVTKIQRESGGLPGNINRAAARYLNGVYRGGDTTEKKAGWLSSFEWPVLAIGAVALCAIGLGLSMFLGNEPDSTVVPVASEEITDQTEEPVVATTSVIESADSESSLAASPSDDNLVLPDTSAVAEGTETVAEVATSTDLVQELPTAAVPAPDTNEVTTVETVTSEAVTVQTPAADEAVVVVEDAVVEDVVPVEGAVVVEEAVVAEEAITQPLNNEPADLAAALADNNVADNNGTTVPIPNSVSTEDTAASKSVGLSTSDGSVVVDTSTITDVPPPDTTENVTELVQGDTDALAQEPTGQSVAIEPIAAEPAVPSGADPVSSGVAVTEPNRAIENERWVLFQSPAKFTVQLATSRERGYIIDLAQTLQVTDPVAIYPFLTSNSNNPVFGLLSGLYDTRAEAFDAVESMSEATKKFGVWIRPMSDLQEDIKRRN